ncbi:MAG: DUF4124 domain-containing protein [Pseudomonadota bacterium]
MLSRQQKPRILIALNVAILITLSFSVNAELLYKHVDKEGKVSYSDKPPKNGEKVERVEVDTSANIVKLQTKDGSGKEQKFADIKARGDARAALRDKLQKEVTTAEQNMEKAKKALEDGRAPAEGETRIVTGKNGNSILRQPEYYTRIAALEEAVNKAETQLKDAENKYRRSAPD